ncbi:MAG TPA: hypothetical protein VE819_00555 [Steroidobacteraceae bacterium]|jgi:hypothetical protein|nr:hypothetical protein [Steroidobacteraceae bacterium]
MTTELQPSEPGAVETYAETVRIRVLPKSAIEQPDHGEALVRGFDPYSTDIGALNAHTKPRRTLDDMRRLSETILRNRRYAK